MRAIESKEQMYLVLKEASLIGINHIETSPVYGCAQTLLGDAIKKLDDEGLFPQDEWIITSKIRPGQTFLEGKREIKRILSDIGKPRIDNIAIHGLNIVDHMTWATTGEGAKLLDWAKEESLINQIGFSSHGSISLISKAIKSRKFEFCSLHIHISNFLI